MNALEIVDVLIDQMETSGDTGSVIVLTVNNSGNLSDESKWEKIAQHALACCNDGIFNPQQAMRAIESRVFDICSNSWAEAQGNPYYRSEWQDKAAMEALLAVERILIP
jgi:hypothetical protein|tara:strand:+ start:1541 stop:1867 length:327 start_codon:yes stop_codon:yes gene_type:complete